MSMRDYAVSDYGMVFNANHLQMLSSQICPEYSEKEWNEDVSARYEYAEKVCDKLCLEYISDFVGEASPIDDDGNRDWRNCNVYSGDTIYYLPLSHYPNLFNAGYKNMEDVVDEIKQRIGMHLPQDFDYRQHIYHICGTYYA